jgi:hypothetical protein
MTREQESKYEGVGGFITLLQDQYSGNKGLNCETLKIPSCERKSFPDGNENSLKGSLHVLR